MLASERVPGWLWRGSWLLLAGVLLALVGGAVVLRLGVADVPPVGALTWEAAAVHGDCLAEGDLTLPALSTAATILLTAQVDRAASSLTAWGVWLDSPDDGPRWEVLPPGYYRTEGQTYPFHHVGEAENTLRLDFQGGTARLWLNREFAREKLLQNQPIDWGLLDDDAVCWQQIAVYATD